MSKFWIHRLCAYTRLFVVLSICSCTMSVLAQTVTWQILPWPLNQNWPGPQGSPATTNGNVITLSGQDVLSVQVFTAPATISCDVLLPAKSTTDGAFELFFVPSGESSNVLPNPNIELLTGESQSGDDLLQVLEDYTAALWGPIPYPISPETTYHFSVNVAVNGQVSWSVNGADVGLSNSVVVPYTNFQIRLSSWQPTQIWQISNFAVASEPLVTCPSITGTWTGQVNVADSVAGYRQTTLSLQVTDQNTNGCLLRGYLNTGSASRSMPWNYFTPGGLWGNVPFTGTILDTTGVILNLGIFGQASATLDMTQTPPVMRKFILLSNGGTANGDTAVGDLTKQPTTP
jgi:hypothetical protein